MFGFSNIYNKHYIRVQDGIVIKGFSDAFETPLETDICINEKGGRHFEIDGQVNSPIINKDRTHKYRYDTEFRKATEEELAYELESIIKQNKEAEKVSESVETEGLILDLLADQEYRICMLELNQ